MRNILGRWPFPIVVVGVVGLLLTAASFRGGAIDTGHVKGDGEMVSPNLVEVVEVDQLHDSEPPPPRGVKQVHHHNVPSPRELPNTDDSLRTISGMVGTVFAPTYLPEGYTRTKIQVLPEMPSADLHFSKGESSIIVSQSKGHYQHPVKRGHSSEVSINGTPGHVVTGGWVTTIHRDGTVGSTDWEEDFTLEVLFQHEDWWILLTCFGEDLPGRNELLAVARSLSPN